MPEILPRSGLGIGANTPMFSLIDAEQDLLILGGSRFFSFVRRVISQRLQSARRLLSAHAYAQFFRKTDYWPIASWMTVEATSVFHAAIYYCDSEKCQTLLCGISMRNAGIASKKYGYFRAFRRSKKSSRPTA